MNVWKNRALNLYSVFFIILLIGHLFVNIKGDDLFFASHFGEALLFDNTNFILYRFNEWSWRVIIESLSTVLCSYPMLWIISDSLLITLLSYLVPRFIIKNFDENENKLTYDFISIILVVIFMYSSYTAIQSAGFIATSLNYVWPFIFAIVHLYSVKIYCQNDFKGIKKGIVCVLSILSLIFAINMEIVLFSLLVLYATFILYNLYSRYNMDVIKYFNDNKMILVYIMIILIMLAIFIKCPGNHSRYVQECSRFTNYDLLTFYNKIDMAVTTVYCMMLTTSNIITLLFLLLLGVYASKLSKNNLLKLVLFIPSIILITTYGVSLINIDLHSFVFNHVLRSFEPYGLLSGKLTFSRLAILVTYILIIFSIIISLFTIYKNDKKLGYILFSLVFISFLSQMIIGFSPSCRIWSYPLNEYPGRWWIIFNGIQIFLSAVLLFNLKDMCFKRHCRIID